MERFGISVAGQSQELLWFLAVGALLGVWYELFRTGRLIVPPSARRVFLEDVMAAAGAAFITQAAALPISSGRVRLAHLLCLLCGAVLYYVTVGKLIHAVLRFLVRLAEKGGEAVTEVLRRGKRKIKKFAKKHKNLKKALATQGEDVV